MTTRIIRKRSRCRISLSPLQLKRLLLAYSCLLFGTVAVTASDGTAWASASSISPSELRKELYRRTVLDNYGPSRPAVCPCDPNPPAEEPGAAALNCAQFADDRYRNTNIRLDGKDPSLPLWPFYDLPLPAGSLDRMICRITCDKITTGDFDLGHLVRVLYLTKNNQSRSEIIDALQEIYDQGLLPFWLPPYETSRTYWSENHMLMWMSSHFLLQPILNLNSTGAVAATSNGTNTAEAFDAAANTTPTINSINADATASLRLRLLHFLDLKLQYGFYEFLSTNYNVVTMAALLNLIDFADWDITIQTKARAVADRLLSDWLLLTNTAGYLFPAAGRNFMHRYMDPPFLSLIWIATGQGAPLDNITAWRNDYLGGFLATSTYHLDPVVTQTWTVQPVIENQFTLKIGHGVKQSKKVHANLTSRVDRTMFQWSAGGYFVPEVALDTFFLVDSYHLQRHKEWSFYGPLWRFPPAQVQKIAAQLRGQTRGTDLSGVVTVNIYKHYGVVLTTLADYLVGNRAGQQWPWAATCHDIAVYTQAGAIGPCMYVETAFEQTHLPDLKQNDNVALISYRPSKDVILPSAALPLLGNNIQFPTQVSLHFPEERFDQVVQYGRWIIGKKEESYVAVWRHALTQYNCTSATTGLPLQYCDPYYYSDPRDGIRGQVWAVVVGNNITHTSFDQFCGIIQQGSVRGRYVPSPLTPFRWITYKTQLRVDGKILRASLRGKTTLKRPES